MLAIFKFTYTYSFAVTVNWRLHFFPLGHLLPFNDFCRILGWVSLLMNLCWFDCSVGWAFQLMLFIDRDWWTFSPLGYFFIVECCEEKRSTVSVVYKCHKNNWQSRYVNCGNSFWMKIGFDIFRNLETSTIYITRNSKELKVISSPIIANSCLLLGLK